VAPVAAREVHAREAGISRKPPVVGAGVAEFIGHFENDRLAPALLIKTH